MHILNETCVCMCISIRINQVHVDEEQPPLFQGPYNGIVY